jgi:branched-chain amino acid transport system ATP-binding protein
VLFPRLSDRRRQAAGSMSGGEQQMCAMARGLMAVPVLLMIDEMSLGLAHVIVGVVDGYFGSDSRRRCDDVAG